MVLDVSYFVLRRIVQYVVYLSCTIIIVILGVLIEELMLLWLDSLRLLTEFIEQYLYCCSVKVFIKVMNVLKCEFISGISIFLLTYESIFIYFQSFELFRIKVL